MIVVIIVVLIAMTLVLLIVRVSAPPLVRIALEAVDLVLEAALRLKLLF
jgi:hypothetical protein